MVVLVLLGLLGLALVFGQGPFSDCDRGERIENELVGDPLYLYTPPKADEKSADSEVVCDSEDSYVLAARRIHYSGDESALIDAYKANQGEWSEAKRSETDEHLVYCFDRREHDLDRIIQLKLYLPKDADSKNEFEYEVDTIVSLYSNFGINLNDYDCE